MGLKLEERLVRLAENELLDEKDRATIRSAFIELARAREKKPYQKNLLNLLERDKRVLLEKLLEENMQLLSMLSNGLKPIGDVDLTLPVDEAIERAVEKAADNQVQWESYCCQLCGKSAHADENGEVHAIPVGLLNREAIITSIRACPSFKAWSRRQRFRSELAGLS